MGAEVRGVRGPQLVGLAQSRELGVRVVYDVEQEAHLGLIVVACNCLVQDVCVRGLGIEEKQLTSIPYSKAIPATDSLGMTCAISNDQLPAQAQERACTTSTRHFTALT